MTIKTLKELYKKNSDLDRTISRDFNTLIKKVHTQLSTKKRSPVYTGFFASSWVAQGSPVRARDDIKKFQPWNAIKQEAMTAFLAGTGGNAPRNPVVKPRFPVKRAFNYTRPVYIGNQVKYAQYALEGGKVQLFIQGSLGKMIRETMTDKGKLFVGGSTTGGFGSFQGGVKYTEFSK